MNELAMFASNCLLPNLPDGVPDPSADPDLTGAQYDRIVICNGKLWAVLVNNKPFSPQEFYLWTDGGWVCRTWQGRAPYKKIMRIIGDK